MRRSTTGSLLGRDQFDLTAAATDAGFGLTFAQPRVTLA